MPRKSTLPPTDVELEILNALWDHGPNSVRAIHNLLAVKRETGYSTTLKMVQVMRDKGLLKRDTSVRPQVYRPALQREETQAAMLDDLTSKAFSGSAQKLVLSLLSAERLSPDELKELQRMAALETARFGRPLALAASGPGKEKSTMKRVRRLLDGRPDVAVGSGALLLVFALLFFTGVAACVAMAGDGKQTEASQPAKKQDNRNEQNNACDQTERAGKEDNGSSGDAVARMDTGLRKDLVVHYSFDDDADGKVYDESGNGNHGVTVGDVKYELSFRGRAPGFTSNRTYILSESAGINMHDWRQVSVSVWIKTNRYTTYGRLISRGEVSGDGLSGIALQAGSGSSKASFSVGRQFQRGPAIWEKLYTSSLQPKAIDRIGKWVHLVGTFDGDRLRFYVNGTLDREVEAGGHNLKLWDRPNHKLVIGNSSMKSRMVWQDKYFDGLVDEVKIWRRRLSSGEIEHVYGQGQQSISSRQVGELSRHARRLLPETEMGVGQQTTGIDLTHVLRDSGQRKDVDAFTADHRFFQRDVKRLVKSKKTWALCALLDHKNVDAKILAARGLLKLADPLSVPVLLAAAKRNSYGTTEQ